MTYSDFFLQNGIDEPLAESAHLARQWAAQHCVRDGAGSSCEHYHGFWPYLRLMDLGAKLGGHPGLYVQAIENQIQAWAAEDDQLARRILISGSADYSMLAHLLHAVRNAPMPIDLVSLDICPTPLKLNDWYAQRVGKTVSLVCENLLDHKAVAAYDLIVTSSFMGFFSPAERPAMFEAYARMLKPGGRLIFSNRLRPGSEAAPAGLTTEAAHKFADQVAQLSHNLPPQAALPAAEIHRMAMGYATIRRPYPVHSIATIRSLADHAGLQWIAGDPVAFAPVRPGVSGPAMSDGSNYVFVILGKAESKAA